VTSLVLDTHSIIWFLAQSARLSNTARQAIRDAIAANNPVYVSAISVVEIVYLVEKGRFSQNVLDDLIDVLRRPDSGIQTTSVDLHVAGSLHLISRNDVPDMPDRIIGTTALHLGLPLVTSDAKLQSSMVPTIW
jgi:PIN domain nuclease of toxin-antitoxin system